MCLSESVVVDARSAFIDFSLPYTDPVSGIAGIAGRKRSSNSVGSTVSIHSERSGPSPTLIRRLQGSGAGAGGGGMDLNNSVDVQSTTTSTPASRQQQQQQRRQLLEQEQQQRRQKPVLPFSPSPQPSPENMSRTRPVSPSASSLSLLEHVRMDKESLQARYDDLQAQAQAMSLELTARQQDKEDYQRVLRTLKAQLASARQETVSVETRLRSDNQTLRQRNLQLEADNTRLDVELDKLRTQLIKVHDSEDLLPELQVQRWGDKDEGGERVGVTRQAKAALQEQLKATKASYSDSIRRIGQERDDAIKELRSQMAHMRAEHNTQLNAAINENEKLRRVLDERESTLQQKLRDANDEISSLQMDLAALRERRKQEQDQFDELRRRDKETWRQREQDLRTGHERAMQTLREEFERDISGLKQRIMTNTSDDQSRVAELEGDVKRLQSELQQQQHVVNARNATLASLQEELTATKKEMESIQASSTEARAELRAARERIASADAENRTLMAARDDWERRAREVDRNASAHVDKLDAELHHAHQQIQVLQGQRDSALRSRDEYADVLHQRVEEVRRLQQQVSTLRQEYQALAASQRGGSGGGDSAAATATALAEAQRQAQQREAVLQQQATAADARAQQWRERASAAEERVSQLTSSATRLQQQVQTLQAQVARLSSSPATSSRGSPAHMDSVPREEYESALQRVHELEKELRVTRQQRNETPAAMKKERSGTSSAKQSEEIEELKNRVEYLQSANQALKEAIGIDDADEASLKAKMLERSGSPARDGDGRRLREENVRLTAECEEWKRKFASLRARQMAPSGTASLSGSFDAQQSQHQQQRPPSASSSVQGTPLRRMGSLRRAKANCSTFG
ncbi:hypothetical protein PTSG_04747 [Salpingoeca rosetta]|uniref:Uncharacterized protein n=1 Tax=Salpingoeca rosetta (strain ATCC 50818 / BSB-021) TaxID=946362 RepID=F2U9K9_SALR5|nr:uncharacterized protein PTSG_04747 [Salpingoeca rosetta]EGD73036.1 hypothetical protein PTSG_04747 [Salpingoeca rosetta]|eukprot:XP_004994067.1 hypothetical protein PTSG_04747 [Salpingoeca rosetta]